MRRLAYVHPFLFAAYPILFEFQRNLGELDRGDLTGPMLLAIAGTAGVFAIAFAALRDAARASLATAAVVILFFSYGHVREGLAHTYIGDRALGSTLYLLPMWTLIAVALVWLAVRARRAGHTASVVLSIMAATLLVMTAVPIATAQRIAEPSVAIPLPEPFPAGAPPRERTQRDIYLLVFDRYPANRTVRDIYGFDNSPFESRLREHGFSIAERARANFPDTIESLASSLNMDYLQELLPADAPGDSWDPVIELVQGHRVGRMLKARGYTYHHIGSWSDFSQDVRIADVVHKYDQMSEFSRLIWSTTLLSAIDPKGGGEDSAARRVEHRRVAQFQFETLHEIASLPGPKFVFAHILLPHRPYVFDRNGDVVGERQEQAWGTRRALFEQLLYTNTRIEELMRVLLAGPDERDPIILLQADEGPYPDRWQALPYAKRFTLTDQTVDELREKYQILNALYLPGADPSVVYPSLSLVNTWRIVFDRYFGTELGLLPDRSYIFRRPKHRYTFDDVTDEF